MKLTRRKFSGQRSRAELIAAWKYGPTGPRPGIAAGAFAQAPPAGGDGRPAPDVSDDNEGATEDQYEPKPYHADPDETVQCPSCRKMNDDDASFCDQCGFQLKGADDVIVEPAAPQDPAVQAAGPPAPEGEHAAPTVNPVDEDGNVQPDVKCANPDCQHLASSHVDTPGGANTGACSMGNCECQGFTVEASPNTGDGGDSPPPDSGSEGAEPSRGSQELTHAPGNAVPDAPMPPGPPAAAGGDAGLNAPPPVEGSENMGPAFTIPVGVIENQATTDGRRIGPQALTWRVPPLPLMGLATETHDPDGFDMNAPAVLCGRIDTLERQPGEGETTVISAKGYYLPNDDGLYYAGLTDAMGRCGISADVATLASEIEIGGVDDDGWPTEISDILTRGEILGFTQVPFPAFAGAYIVLGDGAEPPDAQPIPQQSEAPATPDRPPAAVTAGGQLVHLIAYESCVPCQDGLDVITAAGGPQAPPSAWFENPHFTDGDGRLVEILDRRGQRQLGGKYACPLTVTDDGRVYGHLAPWGVCHIGKPGCVTAPKSQADYAYFKRGQHVITAEGEKIRVGTITVDAGHADMSANPTAAMAHYDNIATAVADVNVGEDEHGIWVAGAIRPTATAAQVAALRASSISGDWRGLGGSLELVAALAVPVPGFPHAVVAAGEDEALVAAGSSVMHRLKHPASPEPEQGGDVALRHALAPLLATSRENARGRLAALR